MMAPFLLWLLKDSTLGLQQLQCLKPGSTEFHYDLDPWDQERETPFQVRNRSQVHRLAINDVAR